MSLSLAERALVNLRVERGEIATGAALLRFNEHDREVIRLAELLHQHWYEMLSIQNCIGIVYDIVSAYQPRVEWDDRSSNNKHGRIIIATAQIGGKQFRYKGRFDERAADQSVVEHFKVHILRRLGAAVGLWLDGKPSDDNASGGQRRITNQ